jgi:hypothetical protein
MKDVRLAGLVDLARVRVRRDLDGSFESRHGVVEL